MFALIAALVQAFLTTLLRHLGGYERPETLSLYFFVIGTLLTGMVMPFVATAPALSEIPLLFGIGLTGAAGQWLYAVALKNTPAALVAVFNYTSIVWAMLFGWLVWDVWPQPIVLLGSAIIVGSSILIAWREHRLYRAAASRIQTL
jgi:drug/metabolite transporter (DMT)-like permease